MSRSFALAHALREARSSWRRIGLYMGSITLGVAALVSINALRSNVISSVSEESRALLGADLRIGAGRAFPERVQALLDSTRASGVPVAYVTRIASMIYAPRSEQTRLVQVRGATPEYPFYGSIETEPAGAWQRLQAERVAVVDPALLVQLNVQVGDSVRIGLGSFVIAGTIKDLPTDISFQTALGPRVFIPAAQLAQTGLLTFGSLARYEAYLKFTSDVRLDEFVDRYRQMLRDQQIRLDTAEGQARQLTNSLDNLTRFLALVGFTALLLGGIGVASAVHVFVKEKLPAIAVLRCLGARQRSVFAAYLLQATFLGFAGAALGVVLGLALQALLPYAVQQFLPVTVAFSIDWLAVAAGLLVGAWVAGIFALIPLLAVRDVSPLQALRRDFETPEPRRDVWRFLAYASLLLSVLLISLWQAPEIEIGFAFAAAIATTMLLLWAVALLLVRATRRFFPRGAAFVVRQGVSNLFRPHNQTVAVTLSLGFGAFLIGTLYLVQRNLLDRLSLDDEANRPNVLLFDVQRSQRAGIEQLLQQSGAVNTQLSPMVTARISAINGQPVQAILADTGQDRPESWALRREYRNTYRPNIAETENVVAGKWFAGTRPPQSPARISVEDGLAENLNVDIGDHITWDVQGLPVESVITSLRHVEWARFAPNFFVVFEPGVLDNAPQSIIALARIPVEQRRAEFQRDLVRTYPNVSSLDLALVQETLDSILDKVVAVIRFLALFSILGGVIVLIGALTTSRFQRMRESALLKTLGASRRQVGRVLLTEYFALGALSGLTGVLFSVVAAWLLVRFFFKFEFGVPVVQLLLLWAGVTALTVLIGVLNSRDVLRRPPLAVLREATE